MKHEEELPVLVMKHEEEVVLTIVKEEEIMEAVHVWGVDIDRACMCQKEAVRKEVGEQVQWVLDREAALRAEERRLKDMKREVEMGMRKVEAWLAKGLFVYLDISLLVFLPKGGIVVLCTFFPPSVLMLTFSSSGRERNNSLEEVKTISSATEEVTLSQHRTPQTQPTPRPNLLQQGKHLPTPPTIITPTPTQATAALPQTRITATLKP